MSVGAVNKQTGERIPTAGMLAVDSVLSGTSTNPVQNRVIKAALDEKVDAENGKGLSTNDFTDAYKAAIGSNTSAIAAIKDGQSIDSFADVETALGEKADTDIVASDFSAAASYTAGDYCIYGGKFYKFKTSHTGAWSASDVDEIKIAGELASLKSGLTTLGLTVQNGKLCAVYNN